MSDELDPGLLRAFAATAETPRNAEFTATVVAHVDRARRMRTLSTIVLLFVALLGGALVAPYAVELSRAVAESTALAFGAAADSLGSPTGIGVAGMFAVLALLNAWRVARRLG